MHAAPNHGLYIPCKAHCNILYSSYTHMNQDIPSPVSTPCNKMMSSVFTTPHPLSSSAPACYTRNSPSTPIKFSLQVEPSPMVSEKGEQCAFIHIHFY